jgi:hypothetical protein
VDAQTELQASEFFRNREIGASVSITDPDTLRRKANLEVNRRALALSRSDPQLKQDLLEYARLQQLYKETASKKRQSWWRALTRRSEDKQK